MTAPGAGFVCPSCRAPVARAASDYTCPGCARRYPIVLGIPDFRLAPDPWLSIDEDRAKGVRLEEESAGLSFDAMVEAYWRMTPGTPPALARRFIDHVRHAGRRSHEWLAAEGLLAASDGGPWIDLGCGTADLAAAVPAGRAVLAVDIAFRWLVVARRRLLERGLDHVTLVCADGRALPFADGAAGRVLSLGLIEHVPDLPVLLREVHRVLKPGGRLHLRATNRFSLLPEPHVNVWGVGFLPRHLARKYVRWRTGDDYRYLWPRSAPGVRRALRQAGFAQVAVRPAAALDSDLERLGRGRAVAGAYNRAGRTPVAASMLAIVAPLIDAAGVAS